MSPALFIFTALFVLGTAVPFNFSQNDRIDPAPFAKLISGEMPTS
jgi:hypothetical protein